MRSNFLVLAAVAVLATAPSALAADPTVEPAAADATGWPQWLGGAARSATRADTRLEVAPGARLVEVWRRPFGSGYAAFSVAGDLAVSALAAEGTDFVVALDAATGAERWRFRLEKTYRGHDGSHDGPLSTPAVVGGAVYALSARGRLVALDAADGALRWSRDLARQDRAKPPHYGFATSPLVTGRLVIVQGDGKRGPTLLALERASGEPAWRVDGEPVRYSSPSRLRLAGVDQVVVAGLRIALGVRLADGEVLWRHPVKEGDFTPIALGPNRLLISTDHEAVALAVERTDEGGLAARTLWRSDEIDDPWGPVLHDDGVIYALQGKQLIAVDATTGAVMWRHDATNGSIIRVGGHVLLLSYEAGALRAIEADREGARDRLEAPVLEEKQTLPPPSYAAGTLYLRGRASAVAVRIVAPE